MGKLSVYNFVSANGCFKGANDDTSWAHQNASKELSDFASENAHGGAILLFGRKTYEMMVSYWPTDEAKKNMPGVADGMNKAEKIVFSKTLKEAKWNNTRVIFEISRKGKKTQLLFRHEGLVPEVECYNDCVKGWDYYIKGSLYKLLMKGQGIPELK